MAIQCWRFNLNNLKTIGAARKVIAPMAIILVSSAAVPVSAQIIVIERSFGTVYHPPVNNSIIYTNPISSPVNSSIIYGSPIPSPVITYPSNFSYPSYYPEVTRVRGNTLTSPVLINPTIRDSTLINPIIIQELQRRYPTERNTTIIRPINY